MESRIILKKRGELPSNHWDFNQLSIFMSTSLGWAGLIDLRKFAILQRTLCLSIIQVIVIIKYYLNLNKFGMTENNLLIQSYLMNEK